MRQLGMTAVAATCVPATTLGTSSAVADLPCAFLAATALTGIRAHTLLHPCS